MLQKEQSTHTEINQNAKPDTLIMHVSKQGHDI